MSSNRRKNIKNHKLRMDIGSIQPQLHDEGFSKRKELDNVMRKARESYSSYWNKRLLEVEERDPNRWRHSGYKELYVGGNFVEDSRNHMRSPKYRNSPLQSPRICSPYRSPRVKNSRSPHQKSPRIISFYNCRERSPRKKNSLSPLVRESNTLNPKSPRSPKEKNQASPFKKFRRQNKLGKRSSSDSSCSDKSCSICLPKHRIHKKARTCMKNKSERPNSKDLVSTKTSVNNLNPNSSDVLSQRLPSSKNNYSRQMNQEKKFISTKKQMKYHNIHLEDIHSSVSTEMEMHVKIEKVQSGYEEKRRNTTPSPSEDSDSSSNTSQIVAPRMTLSERFGKMAQWNVDRKDMENMKITKVGSNIMKVLIEGEEKITRLGYDSPPPGHYPEYLPLQGPGGLDCWDDVRVRYNYYKSRGYLRDLRLQDYIKWEEWWYKYQEWLETERYYEKWAQHASNRLNTVNRKRRGRRNNIH